MEPDDQRLADSLKLAYEQGLEVLFVPKTKSRTSEYGQNDFKKVTAKCPLPAFQSAVGIYKFLN